MENTAASILKKLKNNWNKKKNDKKFLFLYKKQKKLKYKTKEIKKKYCTTTLITYYINDIFLSNIYNTIQFKKKENHTHK